MKDIYKVLDELGVEYVRHDHPAVFTVEESDKVKVDLNAVGTKNLFLRNKNKSQYYLVSIVSDKRADLKELKGKLGEAKLSFGSPEDLMKYLGLTPGSVSACGLINDEDHNVIYVLDKDLAEAERVGVHPNINTATLEIPLADFRKFLDHTGQEVRILEI